MWALRAVAALNLARFQPAVSPAALRFAATIVQSELTLIGAGCGAHGWKYSLIAVPSRFVVVVADLAVGRTEWRGCARPRAVVLAPGAVGVMLLFPTHGQPPMRDSRSPLGLAHGVGTFPRSPARLARCRYTVATPQGFLSSPLRLAVAHHRCSKLWTVTLRPFPYLRLSLSVSKLA